ncbi:MAG: tRNA dihydrouridine(20/20a) synthase DusA [Leptospira sp.]|nr:tRNA dihydrouridine(20/20a) synthase DusA [Leptospira sp.]NCS93508.1 tRNA dihydrouridine(20/20a) synthase DusA [Leptospira sp.]
MSDLDFPLSIAPMMEWTDRHYRFLMRKITKKTILYTEMVTAEAILRGNQDKLLGKSEDGPCVLQLGGDNPEKILQASKIGREYDYDALNLNVGCPSERVQNGSFGACLMKEPNLVAELMLAMREGSDLPVSVKHRIGVNGLESYDDLARFVQIVNEKGQTDHFIVHARIAILEGLSPSENRTIPPLRYEDVFRLKKDFPTLRIEINGGIKDLNMAKQLINAGVDAVMIGRAAYENPMIFQFADQFQLLSKQDQSSLITSLSEANAKFNNSNIASNSKINGSDMVEAKSLSQGIFQQEAFVQPYLESFDWEYLNEEIENYLNDWVSKGGKIHTVLRHALGFFYGQKGGRGFRRYLSENMHKSPSDVKLFRQAMQASGVEV